MKVFTLTLVAVLLVSATSAVKIKRGEKRVVPAEDSKTSEDEVKADITEADSDTKEKEVHKRGIFHYGGASLAASNSFWPRTYAAHYGYGWPSASGYSAAHIHSPSVLKYNTGFHYKSLAAPTVLSSGVHGFSGALPTYASLAPAVSHVHQSATAQPFIIRPGGAVVESYSVTYPRHRAAVAVKPVHAFASVAPVQPVTPVQTVTQVQAVQPVQHTFQTVAAVQPVQHIQPVAAVQPVQPVQPVAPVQPVHQLHPVPPVQSVVQVQHFKPPVHFDVTQEFPSYFQTSFVQPAPVPVHPQRPTVAFSPAQPAFPAIPTFPNPPAFPTIPAVPASPSPSVPANPTIPTIPSIPNFPQPQLPPNSFFPVNVQPPLTQRPPSFGNINPAAQFPGFGPIAGSRPDSGSAEAAPQIPVPPSPSPEPEFSTPQPEPTQQPWKPILYQPPTVQSPVNRPSNTLLPPYGNAPAEGYLPPSHSSNNQKLQQDYTIDSSLFDNLSDADIQEIFAQANLAAQRDHQYHSRF